MPDPERVRTKLGRLEEYVAGLTEKQDTAKRAYFADRDLRDIVERRFQKAIQVCLDIASHVVADAGFREPANYGDLFRILDEESVLSRSLADRMVDLAGFRNVLAHEYASIDDEQVYSHLQDLEPFHEFASEIEAYLQTLESS